MSAYVVNRAHIDLLVGAALRSKPAGQPGVTGNLQWWRVDEDGDFAGWHRLEPHCTEPPDDDLNLTCVSPSWLGQILINENVASVSYRYPDDNVDAGELPGPVDAYYLGPYVYRDRRITLKTGEVFAMIDSFDYQACEHPGWRKSEAFAFLRALREAYCRRVEGYDVDYATAPWRWDDETLAQMAGQR